MSMKKLLPTTNKLRHYVKKVLSQQKRSNRMKATKYKITIVAWSTNKEEVEL